MLNTENQTRGHHYKIFKERIRLNQRKYSFIPRSTGVWNSLTEVVVHAPSVATFEKRLGKLWWDHPIKYNYTEYPHNATGQRHHTHTGKTELTKLTWSWQQRQIYAYSARRGPVSRRVKPYALHQPARCNDFSMATFKRRHSLPTHYRIVPLKISEHSQKTNRCKS